MMESSKALPSFTANRLHPPPTAVRRIIFRMMELPEALPSVTANWLHPPPNVAPRPPT